MALNELQGQTSTAATLVALQRLPVLENLSENELLALAKVGVLRQFSAGTVLFSEGDQHAFLYFVCRGSVTLKMMTSAGKQTILTVGPGDLLAWSALLGDGIMTSTAIAADAVEVVAFEEKPLRQLLDSDSDLGYQVMRLVSIALSRRLLATRLQLLDLYQQTD